MKKQTAVIAAAWALASIQASAQTALNMPILKGPAPVTVLPKSYAGRAVLAANYTVTGGIQTSTIRQATLLPFDRQQQLALRDAFITDGNLADLVDGLGTTLGAAYQAPAHYLDRERFTSVAPSVADLIAYANATTRADSAAAKTFLGSGTIDGKHPASDEAMAIFRAMAARLTPSAKLRPSGRSQARASRKPPSRIFRRRSEPPRPT
ncbi:hypothetical protein [Beijerinckia sp. L45]|uniref:hypothetical protein n=1 Tax=Beijerinckia sp. L45 TaxID=1641855 RepID=UPI00131DA992|nr:hypothetical protein [Beijerinckia sp. L45]